MGVFDNLFRRDNKKEKKQERAKANFIDDEWVEVVASSRDEAIERAATALNANKDHMEIKWLSKDGRKMRARRAEEGSSGQSETRRSSNNNQRDDRGRDRNRSSRRGRGRDRDSRDGNRDRNDRAQSMDAQGYDDDDQGQDDQYNRRNPVDEDRYEARDDHRGRGRDRGQSENDRQYDREVEVYEEEVEEETPHGLKAKEYLLEIVKSIDEPATVELYETNKTIRLEIESSESGLFIGKHGQTLEAIQHVMMKMMMKEEHEKFLVIDAEDYRIRREEALESKARKLAKKAKKEKRPVGVEPMNAIDRRIVHMALKGEPGIETKSIGEGSSRRVLIVPKGFQRRGGGGNNNNRRSDNRDRDRGGDRNYNGYRRDKEYEGPSGGGNRSSHSGGYDNDY